MAFKTFANGAILTDTDLNTYLMKQTVIVCTSATRPPVPVDGMWIYETDTKNLAKYNVSQWEYVAGSRFAFTPTLTASSVNPTMGTGNERYGLCSIVPGPQAVYSFFIRFGSSPAAGTGSYSISLPLTAASPFAGGHCAVGELQLADSSSGLFSQATMFVANGASTAAMVTTVSVTSSSPWTWAQSDYLSGTVTYPI